MASTNNSQANPPRAAIDHVLLRFPPDLYNTAVEFYSTALATLGWSKQHDYPGSAAGFGTAKSESPFWISVKEGAAGGAHVAFKAPDHETVNKFHEEAIKAGGKDEGKPGLRQMYHPNYYAAFVLDPAG